MNRVRGSVKEKDSVFTVLLRTRNSVRCDYRIQECVSCCVVFENDEHEERYESWKAAD